MTAPPAGEEVNAVADDAPAQPEARPAAAARSWASAAGWAVADQGLFAGSSFVINLLLARWLMPESYGAFAVGLAAMTLAGVVHVAILTEPLTVFGPGKHRERFNAYLATVLLGHVAVSAVLAAVLALVGLVERSLGSPLVGQALIAFAAATPIILLLWFLRRTTYVQTQPHHAAWAGLLYLLIVVGLAWVLRTAGTLTLVWAVAVQACAATISAAVLLFWLRPDFRKAHAPLRREVWHDHWRFGRWGIATGLTYYATNQAFFLILPTFHGLEAAGALRAVTNLTVPMALIGTAISSLLTPMLVRSRGTPAFRSIVRRAAVGLCCGGAAFAVLLIVFRRPLLDLAYGGRYMGQAGVLVVLATGIVPAMAVDLLSATLRAAERPRAAFMAFVYSAGVGLTAGSTLTLLYGLRGAAGAIVLCAGTSLIMLAREVYRLGNAVPHQAGSSAREPSTRR